MSNNVQVIGDPDCGGGDVETPGQSFFFANNLLISINGTAVTPHPPNHNNARTANGSTFFSITGEPINFLNNADTCGHIRAGSQVSWFTIQS